MKYTAQELRNLARLMEQKNIKELDFSSPEKLLATAYPETYSFDEKGKFIIKGFN